MFKELYIEIFQKERQKEFLKLCESYDKLNEGKIETKNLIKVILKVTRNKYEESQIKKFVEQLVSDPFEKV
jgi:Ca2+-binding EF-hand superfamily protein